MGSKSLSQQRSQCRAWFQKGEHWTRTVASEYFTAFHWRRDFCENKQMQNSSALLLFLSLDGVGSVPKGGDSRGGGGSMCPTELIRSFYWSHPHLYCVSKKGCCMFLMRRGFACWSYKLSGGLETGQPTSPVPKPERGKVLTGWLKARTRSQSILKEATAQHSCSQLRVPLNYEQNQELLLCMQITRAAPLWLLGRKHPSASACVGIPHLCLWGSKPHHPCAPGFHGCRCAAHPWKRACLPQRPRQKEGVEQKGGSTASEQGPGLKPLPYNHGSTSTAGFQSRGLCQVGLIRRSSMSRGGAASNFTGARLGKSQHLNQD